MATIMVIELWGNLPRTVLAWDQGYRRVIMESDSMATVSAIVNNNRSLNGNYALICN